MMNNATVEVRQDYLAAFAAILDRGIIVERLEDGRIRISLDEGFQPTLQSGPSTAQQGGPSRW